MIDISSGDKTLILKVLEQHLKADDKVFAFGSRVKGQARKNSDLDLLIESNSGLSFSALCDIKESLAETDITFRIDVSNWQLLSDSFKQAIIADRELLFTIK